MGQKIIYGKLYLPGIELKTKKQIYPHLFRKIEKTKYLFSRNKKKLFSFFHKSGKRQKHKKKNRRISVQVHFIFSVWKLLETIDNISKSLCIKFLNLHLLLNKFGIFLNWQWPSLMNFKILFHDKLKKKM